MNDDHQCPCPRRIVRLGVVTALFVIASGLPESVAVISRVVRALVVG